VRHGDHLEFEAELLRLGLEDRVGLLAVGRVVIEQHDLLALELVPPSLSPMNFIDADRGVPVVREHGEDPREDAAVGRVGAAVAERDQRNLVRRGLVDHRVRDAGRQRVDAVGAVADFFLSRS
jgi:hypothetical protein